MLKKRMRKKDTKKGAGPARASADLSANRTPGGPFGSQNGVKKHQNLLKIEQKSKNREEFRKKTEKVIFLKNAIPPS